MAWTSYHDGLLQEMAVLMTEPDWSSDATITARLYGEGGPASPDPNSIAGRLATAGGETGRIPKFETDAQGNPTGKIERDGSGEIVWQSPDEGMASLLEQFETARIQGNAANEQRYNQLLSGYNQRTDNILGTTRDADGNITGGLPTMNALAQAYGGDLDAVTSGFGQREADVMANFNQYGGQARQDIANRHTQQNANLLQSMQKRGLGNTTMLDSASQGLGSQQTQDLARFDQDLSRQRADLLGSLRGATLGAQSQAAQGKAAFGQQQLGTAAALTAEPLGVTERRTDTVPSLSDVANLSTLYGRGSATSGFSLGGLSPTSYYQPKQQPIGG